jgi:hypothetical protein
MSSRAGGGADSLSSTASKDDEEDNSKGGVASLPCGICSVDLIKEPCSIQCDNSNCKTIFHPSCLGNDAPADSEKWFCIECRDSQQQSAKSDEEIEICPSCNSTVGDVGILCEGCNTWFHKPCSKLSNIKFKQLSLSRDPWFCDNCSKQNNHQTECPIVWGDYCGIDKIYKKVSCVLDEISSWTKNLFFLPWGKVGKDFIKEVSRLLDLFSLKTAWEPVALGLSMIFVPLMLQRPSSRSKAKENAKYLASRLLRWSNGQIDELLEECRTIQARLQKSMKNQAESNKKAFCRLMLQGNISKALKYIDSNSSITGVHSVDKSVLDTLKSVLDTLIICYMFYNYL